MQAYVIHYRGKPIRRVVKVLSIGRTTAHIEARRLNGAVVRKYVKLSRLRFS